MHRQTNSMGYQASLISNNYDVKYIFFIIRNNGHEVGTNIHGCQPTLAMSFYVLKADINLNIPTGSVC
jgi:hypothetical protein